MLNAILIILCLILWVGMVCAYFHREIREWLDNRYGPDHKEFKPRGKPFWRFYD